MKEHLGDLVDIDKQNKSNRVITLAAVIGSLLFAAGAFFYSNYRIDKAQNSIWVLVNGKALELAMRHSTLDNRPVEVVNHVTNIMSYLFTLTPDADAIENNIQRALELGDYSVKKFTDELREQKYYNNIISGNVTQAIKIDSSSIKVDYSVYPYKVAVNARLEIIRPSNITIREIVCTMNVRNLEERTQKNAHGLLVEKFDAVSNNTIKSYTRDEQ